MKWVLFLIFSSSGGAGIAPHSVTAEFGDLRSCEMAAKRIDRLTASYRVMGSKVDYECLPYDAPK